MEVQNVWWALSQNIAMMLNDVSSTRKISSGGYGETETIEGNKIREKNILSP